MSQLVRFDWAMKTLLRDKANFDILEGFLSALLKERITVLELIEGESNREDEHLKYNRVDLMVKNSKGEHLIIEVQNESEVGYLKRLLYGTSKVIVENLKIGEAYDRIKKVISISIIYFDIGKGDDYIYHGTTVFKGVHTHHALMVKEEPDTPYFVNGQMPVEMAARNIFPEYYLIPVKAFPGEILDDLDEWVYMFKNDDVPAEFHALHIDKAREKLALLKMDAPQRKRYEQYMRAKVSDEGALEDSRRKGLAEGWAKGIKQAEKETKRAEKEKQRAEKEKQRAEKERQHAEKERERAEQAEEKLREEQAERKRLQRELDQLKKRGK